MDKILAQLAAQIDKLGTVAWDQAPLIYRDLLLQGLITNGLGTILALLIMGAAVWFGRMARKESQRPHDRCPRCGHYDDGEGLLGLILGAVLTGILALVILGSTFPDLLTAWLAPRAYILSVLR